MNHLTPAEAAARASRILTALAPIVSDWTTAVLDQAVLALDDTHRPFGSNDLRLMVPADDMKHAGLYFHHFTCHDRQVPERDRYLIWCGDVTSINKKARGKKVGTYLLTGRGRKHIEDRIAARTTGHAAQQERAA